MFFFHLQYPQSNIRVIMDDVLKLVQANGGAKQLMSRYIEQDPDDAGYVSEKTFRLRSRPVHYGQLEPITQNNSFLIPDCIFTQLRITINPPLISYS